MSSACARLKLQPRDLAFLRGLFECRVMTLRHAAALYFDGHVEMAKKRLQKLKAARLVSVRPRRSFEPSVLFLTTGGLEMLRAEGILDLYPPLALSALQRRAHVSDATLRHELSVMDLKVAFHVAVKSRDGIAILDFTTWPLLNQFEGRRGVVRPDAFVRLSEKTAEGCHIHNLYIELDRSTEPLVTLCERTRSYLTHNSRELASCQPVDGQPRRHVFRVLFVVKSDERRENFICRLISANIATGSLVWLSTTDAVKSGPLDAIWQRPVDFIRDAKLRHQLLAGHRPKTDRTGPPGGHK